MTFLRNFSFFVFSFFSIALHSSVEADLVRALLIRGPGTREIYQGEPKKNLLPVGEEYVDRPWHGYYNDERHAFQQKIIASYLDLLKSVESPEVILTAGAFGSGKTRILGELFSQRWLNREDFLVINMDHFRNLIPEYQMLVNLMKTEPAVYQALAKEFSLKDPGTYVQIEVGYLQEMLLWQALDRGVNIIIDGSMANREYFDRFLNAMRDRFTKYSSVGVIHADAGDQTLSRALQRGLENLRVISEENVLRSIREVEESFSSLKTRFNFYIEVDNSGQTPTIRRVGTGTRSEELSNIEIPLINNHREWRGQGSRFDQILNGRLRKKLPYYDIAFDIDWTLFYVLNEAVAGSLEFNGQHFLPYRGLKKFFQVLLEMIPNLRIHFMSGAPEARIKKFLQETQISENENLFDLSYTVVGVEGLHLRDTSKLQSDTKKFTDIYAKSFHSLTPLANVERSILIDDQPSFALEPLRGVNSLGNFAYYSSFAAAEESKSKYAPKTYQEWELDRDRLALLIAVIEEAYRRDQNGRESFATAMQNILGTKASGEMGSKAINDPSFASYFDRGRELLSFTASADEACSFNLILSKQ